MTAEPAERPRAPRRPKGLGRDAAALWRDVTGKYELRADELRLLEAACREVDLCERLEDAQREAPLTVMGSQGQQVASPFLTELRQHRNTLRGLLGALHLPDDEMRAPNRPGAFTATSGLAAARSRWSGTARTGGAA